MEAETTKEARVARIIGAMAMGGIRDHDGNFRSGKQYLSNEVLDYDDERFEKCLAVFTHAVNLEAAKIAAAAPDKDKILAWAKTHEEMDIPEIKDEALKKMLFDAKAGIDSRLRLLINAVNDL